MSEEKKEKNFYTKSELEEFREIINNKLVDAREEHARLVKSLKEANGESSDGYNASEFGSESVDKEQSEMFMARQMKFIDSLQRAIIRIENGTYGRCKVTGKLISKERLRIVPHTESSMEAKLKQYDRGPRKRNR